jgi:hypothetical protein
MYFQRKAKPCPHLASLKVREQKFLITHYYDLPPQIAVNTQWRYTEVCLCFKTKNSQQRHWNLTRPRIYYAVITDGSEFENTHTPVSTLFLSFQK